MYKNYDKIEIIRSNFYFYQNQFYTNQFYLKSIFFPQTHTQTAQENLPNYKAKHGKRTNRRDEFDYFFALEIKEFMITCTTVTLSSTFQSNPGSFEVKNKSQRIPILLKSLHKTRKCNSKTKLNLTIIIKASWKGERMNNHVTRVSVLTD